MLGWQLFIRINEISCHRRHYDRDDGDDGVFPIFYILSLRPKQWKYSKNLAIIHNINEMPDLRKKALCYAGTWW